MGYNLDKLSGHSKELLGKASGNKKLELKGRTQHQLAGMKDKASDTVHRIEDSLSR